MADYKELLRRAVEALPENNGAARRAVYEKARAALGDGSMARLAAEVAEHKRDPYSLIEEIAGKGRNV